MKFIGISVVRLFFAAFFPLFYSTQANEIFPPGSQWKYFKGLTEPVSADDRSWRVLEFDDSNWAAGPAPFFYGETLTGTQLIDMNGGYSTVFFRKQISIADAGAVASLRLRVASDDGYIAWLNGVEIARVNVSDGDPVFNDAADGPANEPVTLVTQEIAISPALLKTGNNLLAIQAFNAALADEDFVFDAGLDFVRDETAPAIEEILPIAGATVQSLLAVEVHFNEAVVGVQAEDLLINGAPSTNVFEAELGKFVFTFPHPADGLVTVDWSEAHGITDRAGHPFVASGWNYRLDRSNPAPGVMISEFMAENANVILDEDRVSSDWIELFNSGSEPANLDGWFLTDTTNNLTKWKIPPIILNPGEYRVIFASEKNKTNLTGRYLHTNFRLSNGGEYLGLLTPLTNVASEFHPTYPEQFPDVSYGRTPGAAHISGYFYSPTPGKPNVSTGQGFAGEVKFSRDTTTFQKPFELLLTTEVVNGLIRYTTDGNMPTNGSPLYTGAIRITNTVQIRARVFQEGLLPGPPHSETYLLLSNNVLNFTSTLPVMVLHTMGKGAPSSGAYKYAHFSLFEPLRGVTSLTNPPSLSTRAGIKLRGSSTEGIEKSSLALELWDEFNVDKDRSLLGMPADSDWVLYAPNQFDPVLIHNPFIHQIGRDMGEYSPRTRFVEVHLNKGNAAQVILSSNTYFGLYVLEEKIKIAPHRVDIDPLEPNHVAEPEVTGGYLMKIDRFDPGDTGVPVGTVNLAMVDPKESDLESPQRDPQEKYLRKYFSDYTRVARNADPVVGYPAFIDVDQWIRYHVLEVLSGNVDALVLSAYFHKPRNGKIRWGPHWDFDRALGSTDGRDFNPRTWSTGPFFSANFWATHFGDKDFWQKWVDTWQLMRQSHFSNANMHRLIDEQVATIGEAQVRDQKRWASRLPYTYRKATGAGGGTYATEVQWMKNWLSNRTDFIDRQLTQPPQFSSSGGPVDPGFLLELTGPPNANIYYTLDGTDPRKRGVANTPIAEAFLYTEPIRITGNTRVVARALDPSKRQSGAVSTTIFTGWSMPVEATFVITPLTLGITEIMFHPEPPALGSTALNSDFEFVEIKNTGAATVNLVGVKFIRGIEFTFTADNGVTSLAPGERVLIVKNKAAFLSRYPGVTNIAGEFSGSLANEGNHLVLVGGYHEPIADFAYNDSWEPLADGFGFSLVLADETTPSAQLGDRSRWRLSSQVGGSPGQSDAPRPAIPTILINEALTHTDPPLLDAIELHNPTSSDVDVTHWYLTDDFRVPKKYRITAPARIPAHGYLVIDETRFRPTPETGFALSSLGDELYLFSGDAQGNLTGHYHGFAFGAIDNGGSFGFFLTSDGRDHFPPQTRPTPGQPNAGPRPPNVVVSEIMYEPTPIGEPYDSDLEFIEIRNPGTQSVALFDEARPTNSWRLNGAVDYLFPRQTVLPPKSSLIVVGFNPANEPVIEAEFRATYRLDASVPLYGPWQGNLDNRGEELRLERPDVPQAPPAPNAGFVPYIAVEEIEYARNEFWTRGAAGTGFSLQRLNLLGFANEPAHWFAAPANAAQSDSDADGLPDQWETAHGLSAQSAAGIDGAFGDADNDGFTNFEEYVAGTAPKDAASLLQLRASVESNGQLTLRFSGSAGRQYTILYRESAESGPWQVLRTLIANEGESVLTTQDAPGSQTRFYRLQSP